MHKGSASTSHSSYMTLAGIASVRTPIIIVNLFFYVQHYAPPSEAILSVLSFIFLGGARMVVVVVG